MTELPEDRAKWLKFGLILLGVGVLAAVVWSVVPSAIYFGVFAHTVDRIVEATGWSRNLVRGFAVVALSPLAWAVTHVLSLRLRERVTGIFQPTTAARQRKLTAQGVIIFYIASYFFVMYSVYRNTAFVSVDGKPVAVRWVALTPDGCEFFEEPGVHRRYGIPLEPVTPEMVAKCDQIKKGDAPRPIVVKALGEVQFFDPIRGTPLVFYYQRPDGRFDLFSRAGVHPLYGAPLREVDAAIVEQVRRQLAKDEAARSDEDRRIADVEATQRKLDEQRLLEEAAARQRAESERQRQRYLATSSPGPHRVVLVTSSGRAHQPLTQRFGEAVRASTGLLSDTFVSDGVFGNVMGGDYGALRAVEMERVLALMVLADVRSRGESSVVAGETVFKSTAQIRVVVVRPTDGYSAESFSVDGVGSGFSMEAAERAAADQAASAAVARLTQYR